MKTINNDNIDYYRSSIAPVYCEDDRSNVVIVDLYNEACYIKRTAKELMKNINTKQWDIDVKLFTERCAVDWIKEQKILNKS